MAGEPDAGSQGVESEAMREALMRSWRARRARRVEGVRGGMGVLAEGGSGAEMMLALGVVLVGGWLGKGGRGVVMYRTFSLWASTFLIMVRRRSSRLNGTVMFLLNLGEKLVVLRVSIEMWDSSIHTEALER